MELNNQYIGNFIKAMRKKAGFTQCELAERIGVGNRTVSKWEQGRGIPDISLLYQLSVVLDIDIESILSGSLEDLGKVWIGLVYMGKTETRLVGGKRDLEYFISIFLLVGIRDIIVVSSDKRMQEDRILLKEYQVRGFLKRIWCFDSFEEIVQNSELQKKYICFLYQPAFLYGMHLTRYMRRAMLREKVTVLALRQGEESFMHPICYDSNFRCVLLDNKGFKDNLWRMFPMIFGYGKYLLKRFDFAEDIENNKVDASTLLTNYKEVYVEPMERGMLAFSMKTEGDRALAGQVLSGIEKSQHIQIGNPDEIMRIRGWK